MTRAEEAAMRAYPNNDVVFFAEDNNGKMQPVTEYGREINGFIRGYEQAEKDLGLTAEDIKMIDDILIRIDRVPNVDMSRKEFYEEVLRRYKEAKQ